MLHSYLLNEWTHSLGEVLVSQHAEMGRHGCPLAVTHSPDCSAFLQPWVGEIEEGGSLRGHSCKSLSSLGREIKGTALSCLLELLLVLSLCSEGLRGRFSVYITSDFDLTWLMWLAPCSQYIASGTIVECSKGKSVWQPGDAERTYGFISLGVMYSQQRPVCVHNVILPAVTFPSGHASHWPCLTASSEMLLSKCVRLSYT